MKVKSINTEAGGGINSKEKININNCMQYISIKGNNINNPFLLVLHGGPGDASLPLVRKYNKALEDYYNVIVWEQRGSGKSYYRFTKENSVTINTFVEDVYELVKLLLKRFNRKKLFLTAHSWGSVIGLKFISRYPELIHAYIGCGQVVNMQENARISYEFALMKSTDKNIIEKLKKTDWTCTRDNWYEDLMLITRQVIKYKGSLYHSDNYNKFILVFLKSKEYSIPDLVKRTLGSAQSIKLLWRELLKFNAEDILSYKVPVIFMEGRHDYHASSNVVGSYYEKLYSDKALVWFEQSAHFPQWEEADKYNKYMIQLKRKMNVS